MIITMLLKCGIVDKEEIRSKLDVIKKEPKQRVQASYDRM
jgi:hypothetical protein